MSPVRYTERGFAVYTEFKDRYDARVDVTKSSLATEPCVWIHVHGDEATYAKTGLPNNDGSIHLTPIMAARIIGALSEWLGEVTRERCGDSEDKPSDHVREYTAPVGKPYRVSWAGKWFGSTAEVGPDQVVIRRIGEEHPGDV